MSNYNWIQAKKLIEFDKGYVLAMFTDRVIVSNYPLDSKNEELFNSLFEKYMLDCRIFNEKSEYRFFRGDIGKNFNYRYIDDTDKDIIDREYYLDIDTVRSKGSNEVYAIGAGKYALPINNLNDAKIRIKEYLDRDDYGHARVYDWRLCGFVEGK